MEQKIVEAIDEGRIVRVSEEHARREGLLILRRPIQMSLEGRQAFHKQKESPRSEEDKFYNLDRFRRPLKYKQNDLMSSLKNHFHWEISRSRKMKGLSRKQLAGLLQCSEQELKLLENGVLPGNDYILLNKVEKFFGINLRKDEPQYHSSMRELALSSGSNKPAKYEEAKEKSTDAESIIGDSIGIID